MYLLTTDGQVELEQVEAELAGDDLGGQRLAGARRPGEQRDQPARRDRREAPVVVDDVGVAVAVDDRAQQLRAVRRRGRCRPTSRRGRMRRASVSRLAAGQPAHGGVEVAAGGGVARLDRSQLVGRQPVGARRCRRGPPPTPRRWARSAAARPRRHGRSGSCSSGSSERDDIAHGQVLRRARSTGVPTGGQPASSSTITPAPVSVASRTSAAQRVVGVGRVGLTRNRRPDDRRIASWTRRTGSSPVTATSAVPSLGPSRPRARPSGSCSSAEASPANAHMTEGRDHHGVTGPRPVLDEVDERGATQRAVGSEGPHADTAGEQQGQQVQRDARTRRVVVEVADEPLATRVGLDGHGDGEHLGVPDGQRGVVGECAERRRLAERVVEPFAGRVDGSGRAR